MKKGLALVGMPGCGKTYWGQQLSAYWGWRFIDLDDFIETESGRTIAEIFALEGEEGFRKRETQALRKLISIPAPDPFVMAVGGGLLSRPENQRFLKAQAWQVYLQARMETLIARLRRQGEAQRRPLLATGADWEPSLLRLFQQRRAAYEAADWTLQVEELDLPMFDQVRKSLWGNGAFDPDH